MGKLILDDADGLLGEGVSLRAGRQLDSDREKLGLEGVVVLLALKRRPVQPQDERPEGIQDISSCRHGGCADLLLDLVDPGPVEVELVEQGPRFAAQLEADVLKIFGVQIVMLKYVGRVSMNYDPKVCSLIRLIIR